MLSEEEIKEKKMELIRMLKKHYGEMSDKFINDILAKGMTCDTCLDNDNCEFAFNGYNMFGDCLMLK